MYNFFRVLVGEYSIGSGRVQFGLEIDEGLQVQSAAALMVVGVERETVVYAQGTEERDLESDTDADAVLEIVYFEIVYIQP